MKKHIFLSIIFLLPFLVSCTGKSIDGGKEVSDKNIAPQNESSFYYQEEKTDCEESLPSVMPEREYGRLMDFYETKQGDIYFLFVEDRTQKKEEEQIYRQNGPNPNADYASSVFLYVKEENAFQEIPLQIDSGIWFSGIRASEEGTILLFDTLRAYVYQKDSKESSADFPANLRGGGVFADETHFICQPNEMAAYMVFDLQSGEKTSDYISLEFLEIGMSGHSFLTENQEEQLLMTGSGIYRKEGEEWILQVPSERTSMILDDFYPAMLWREGEDYFIRSEKDVLYHYRKVQGERGESVSLKVTSAVENTYLKEAVVRYQIENPQVEIIYEFEEHKKPENFQDMDSLLKRVNTQIVSDEAADVYLLDLLPWEDYKEKGYLLDVSEAVAPYVGTGEYFDGVLTGYEEKEGTFAIPLYFQADYFLCTKEMVPYVQELSSFSEYLKENPEKEGVVPYYYKNNARELFFPMLYQFYRRELYEEEKITKEKLTQFLSSAKILYDRLMENEAESQPGPYPTIYRFGEFYQKDELWQLFGKQAGEAAFLIVGEVNQTLAPQIFHYDEEYELIPTGQFHPIILMGVHAGTEHPEEALDFLSFLIAYEKEYNQAEKMVRNRIGIPLVKESIPFWMNEWKKVCEESFGWTEGYWYEKAYGEEFPMYVPENEDGIRLMKSLEQFSIPGEKADPLINSDYAILKDGITGYFEGEKSLEITVNEIYERITLKQSEEG